MNQKFTAYTHLLFTILGIFFKKNEDVVSSLLRFNPSNNCVNGFVGRLGIGEM
jgi:hypothetical protein